MSDELICRLSGLGAFAGAVFWPGLSEVRTVSCFVVAILLTGTAMILKAISKVGKENRS